MTLATTITEIGGLAGLGAIIGVSIAQATEIMRRFGQDVDGVSSFQQKVKEERWGSLAGFAKYYGGAAGRFVAYRYIARDHQETLI